MNYFQKIMALMLAATLLLGMIPMAMAQTSDEIRSEIDKLADKEAEIQDRIDGVEAEIQENWASIEEMVAYKNSLDEQIFLHYAKVENLNAQISAYTVLIAQTQAELDEAQAKLDEMNHRYRVRVRAMEEEGKVSYWEVLFKANSFLDLIDRLNMIREIAAADQRMIAQLRDAADAVAAAKAALEEEKQGLEESRLELQNAQVALNAKREESSAILQRLNEEHRDLQAQHAEIEAEKQALVDQIAAQEKALTEALKREEEERRRQEEEERKKREEEERKKREEEEQKRKEEEEAGNGGSTEPTEPTEPEPTEPPTHYPSDDDGWVMPCSYIMITSAYGWRSSGWHNGVDFANNRGTPIYASRSGTVTTAKSLNYSYGNYVVINHHDGYSSLYAHMDYYIVDVGDYVVQGQLIGYMGSTGNSTGNHLHFTVFYDGSTINPMDVL